MTEKSQKLLFSEKCNFCQNVVHLRITIWHFIEAFVILHIEGHPTFSALETGFMPNFIQTFNFFNGVNRFTTLGTLVGHFSLNTLAGNERCE